MCFSSNLSEVQEKGVLKFNFQKGTGVYAAFGVDPNTARSPELW